MEIPLRYSLTLEMVDLIVKIEAKKAVLENILIPPKLARNIQRQSLLKSSLFSAKIEGNKLEALSFDSLRELDPDLTERMEVENILSAFSFIDKNIHKGIDAEFILSLHSLVMRGLTDGLGKLRQEPSAIFNQSGFVVHMPPLPSEVKNLLEKLIAHINLKNNENILIKASLSHMSFEKIHPFLDGNGRVGRLLLQAILLKGGYGFNRLLSIEELLNERKEEYYLYLDKNDATGFIEFMLDIILTQAKKILNKVDSKGQSAEDLLLPRRKEILEIVRDHKAISLDSIKRRFNKVSSRMLRYDLKKLELSGLIVKLGTTRGAMYKIK